MSLPTIVRPTQPRASTASCRRLSSSGKSMPASSSTPTSAERPATSPPASASSCSSTRDAAVQPEVMGRAERAARDAEHLAVAADEREVGLRVAAVDGQDDAQRENLGSEPLEQPVDQLELADQRVREQRLACVDRVAADRRAHRQPLVRGDVLHEPEQLGRERRLRQRHRPVDADPGGHLDHVVGGEPGERVAVPDVDLVHGAVSRGQRRDQPERGLAVVGAAPLHRAAPACRPASGRGRAAAARARCRRRPAPAGCRPAARGSTASCA